MRENFALGKSATQSSTSKYSRSRYPTIEASVAVNGDTDGNAFFHTDTEDSPWWQVDLGKPILIDEIRIFNRRDVPRRLSRFTLLRSHDGENWIPFFSKKDDTIITGALDPYSIKPAEEMVARFLRVRSDKSRIMHFREFQVFGKEPHAALGERLLKADAEIMARRHYIPEGRTGEIHEIDDVFVFLDRENYEERIIRFIKSGAYEAEERRLAEDFLGDGDRVLELGTAIGVVAMKIASKVGAANVATFDANPDILADARQNFKRNQLEAIDAQVGLMKSRASMVEGEQSVPFYIAKAFWASRLNASVNSPGILRKVDIPVFCLEDEIKKRNVNTIVCDIEGGEVDLFMNADLTGVNKIMMETHYWSAGEKQTDNMVRKLISDGFNIHLGASAHQRIYLRR